MLELLFDPMFRLPFLTGLLLAPMAAVVGVYLRLREEWLAALAYAQVAAAGGVIAVVVHAPVMLGALLAAGLVAIAKGVLARPGNDHFVMFVLLGWAVALVAAAFSAHGEMVGKSLMDGQLYFTGSAHLLAAGVLLVAGSVSLVWVTRKLLMDRFFPDHFSANGIPAWRHQVLFDLLVVATVAITTTAFGVMAAFALFFVPAWIAWGLARGWAAVLWLAAGIALVTYMMAFVVAMAVDQPFGPVMVLTLGAAALLRPVVGGLAHRFTPSEAAAE